MLAQLRHRGPDEFGVFLGEGVALGSARLSIVDIGGGQQPISNEDGALWIVFNGEIFNYVELRAELEGRGHRFATHSDTEVIVHLYEELGPACQTRLNGQWAFAIWDRRLRRLCVGRDRVGVRPAFYTEVGGQLLFASEVKAFFGHPAFQASPDLLGVQQVFNYWSPQAPRTCFMGVRELPPGCFLLADEKGVRVERYWEPRFGAGPVFRSLGGGGSSGLGAGDRSAGDMASSGLRTPDSGLLSPTCSRAVDDSVVAQFHELLTDAVRIRLRADVPVGAYLSGGLDSSAIAYLVREAGVSRLDTFSIAFDDEHYDESAHQLQMARFLGTEHQVVRATHADIARVFEEVVWHAETPLLRTAPAPMFMLSDLVRKSGYKVVLTGEGADEFLGGYDIFKETMVRRFWARQPNSAWRWRLLQRLYPDIRGLGTSGAAYLKAFFGAGLGDTASPGYSHATRWRNTSRCHRFFSKDFLATLAVPDSRLPAPGSQPLLSSVLCPPSSSFGDWGPLERAQYVEISTFLSSYLLSSQGDRMGMAHSIEGRYPFLDARVMEFCLGLPSRWKLRGLQDKRLLRRLMKGRLPADIVARPKRPYRAPIHRSFLHPGVREQTRELLSESTTRRVGWFKPEAVAGLWKKMDSGGSLGETDDMALVGMISSHHWHRRFVESRPETRPIGEGDKVKVVRF